MARHKEYAYQSIPDVGPYGTATNRAGPSTGYDTGPMGGLFGQGFIPSTNPPLPSYVPPPATPGKKEDPVRDAIAREVIRNAAYEQGYGGGGYTSLGLGDPDNPTPPAQEQAAVPQAVPFTATPEQTPSPPVAVPQTPPDQPAPPPPQSPPEESVEQGPATPTGVVTSAPIADISITPTDPTPPQKGEPTPEEDAAALAQANQQAQQEGFQNADGTPGKGVTVSTANANLAVAPSITGVTNQNNQNMSFAPAPQAHKGDPDAVTQGITPSAVAAPAPPAPPASPTASQLGHQASQQAAANLAAAQEAEAQQAMDALGTPAPTSLGPAPTAAPAAAAVSPASLGLNAPTGVTGVNTGLQQGYFGDPNQTSTLGQVTGLTGLTPNNMAMSVTDAQAIADAMSVAADAEASTAADPGIASGITGETADSGIGLSGIGFGQTGEATNADGTVGGVSVGGLGEGIGLGAGQSVGPGPDGGVAVGFGGTADGPSGQDGGPGSIGGAAAAAAGAAAGEGEGVGGLGGIGGEGAGGEGGVGAW